MNTQLLPVVGMLLRRLDDTVPDALWFRGQWPDIWVAKGSDTTFRVKFLSNHQGNGGDDIVYLEVVADPTETVFLIPVDWFTTEHFVVVDQP